MTFEEFWERIQETEIPDFDTKSKELCRVAWNKGFCIGYDKGYNDGIEAVE